MGVRTGCQGQGRYSWESSCPPWGDKHMLDLLTGSSSSQVWGAPQAGGHTLISWREKKRKLGAGDARADHPASRSRQPSRPQPPLTLSGQPAARLSPPHLPLYPSTPQGFGRPSCHSTVQRLCTATCHEGIPPFKGSISMSGFTGPNRKPVMAKGLPRIPGKTSSSKSRSPPRGEPRPAPAAP